MEPADHLERFATIVRKRATTPPRPGAALTLPPDLLQKVRSRVKLAVTLIFIGFAVDPAVSLGLWVVLRLAGESPAGFTGDPFSLANDLAAMALSGLVWALARTTRASQTLLLNLGLVYEVVICLVISLSTYHHFAARSVEMPHLTWVVPIIIFFPLIVPSPPRKMLLTAIAAAGTTPVGMLILHLAGSFTLTVDQLLHGSLNSALAVFLAYFAAKIVYGLNEDVVQARQMGSYRLVERLGRGGMGEVWRAEHRFLARPAAIKLIPPEMLAAGTAEEPEVTFRRLEKEAQAIALLQSPHTVTVYDFGHADDGSFFYVMELLEGLDLATLVGRYGPVAPSRVVSILLQICHSLAEAHERGLVHRDIKPTNIFLCRYGREFDHVKVLDFGLVKTREDAVGADPGLTAADVVGGTPAFMAPEQAVGGKDIDGRADVYALGCVGYWLLTGCLVFESDTALEMITRHLRDTPVPPSQLTEITIPPELEQIILACLEKKPADRPRDVVQLAKRLAAVATPESWTREKAADWWRLHQPIGHRD